VLTPDEFKRLLRRLGARRRLPGDEFFDRMTRREKDVLNQLASGQSTREIAHGLGMSVTTVNAHIQNIVRKSTLPPNNGGAGVREPRRTPPSDGSTSASRMSRGASGS
jgi:hypothetical protein